MDSYYQGSVLKIDGKTMVLTGEGRAVNSGSWTYEYDLKDHLGNTRVSYAADDADVSVLQTKDYYPFGMEMTNGYSNSADATKYLYNGKELQDEGGLDFYDYGARMYDPAIGRWHNIDKLAEDSLQISFSPYHYGKNNPIIYIDPDGNVSWKTVGQGALNLASSGAMAVGGIVISVSTEGAGMPLGVPMVMKGATDFGLALHQTLEGFSMEPDEKYNDPTGTFEMIGAAFGDKGKEAGSMLDFGTGFLGGFSTIKGGVSLFSGTGAEVLDGILDTYSIGNKAWETKEKSTKESDTTQGNQDDKKKNQNDNENN